MMYGHRWVSSFGEKDDGTWCRGLGDISVDELRHGLDACLKNENPWPPTLPEFRALCRPKRFAYHQDFPKLAEKPTDRNVALAATQKMLALLAKK